MEHVIKPPALVPGSSVRVIAPAGTPDEKRLRGGLAELERLGYRPVLDPAVLTREGYFAGPHTVRAAAMLKALTDPETAGIVCARGGYGTAYLLEALDSLKPQRAKPFVGFSDLTMFVNFAWRRWHWVTFYGAMVAFGLDKGPGVNYDERSFRLALTETGEGWDLPLRGETLREGEAEGRLLGGTLTLLRSLIGTRWEPDTRGSILLIEDLNMKPYQVDRALMHLKLAGKLDGVRGIVLGDFPGCQPPDEGGPTVRQVCERVLAPTGIPVVWGSPVGHTSRPMLTVPLGIRARLAAHDEGRIDFLEPAVVSA